jgi:phosphoribosylformylglycinamidine synthase
LDEQPVRAAHEKVRDGVRAGALRNAHDIAEGGLAVAVAECCIAGGIGARIELPNGLDPFAEAPGRAFVVSGDVDALDGSLVIGRVGGSELEIDGILRLSLERLRAAWDGGLATFVR